MTRQRETPASLRRQAEGSTGVRDTGRSVAPGWARKPRGAALVRFGGEYMTPAALHAQIAAEAAQSRTGGGGHPRANPLAPVGSREALQAALLSGERPPLHPADPLPPETGTFVCDGQTGEVLPCRFLETTQPSYRGKGGKGQPHGLAGPHRKVAAALAWNVAHLCGQYGIERVGFLTLTFADHVTDVREASRRFNSLATHVLRKRYAAFIRVLERQKSGRIHYHLLVVLPDDIRTGADFAAFEKRDYKTANNHLRREWAFWRHTAPAYRFGRTELLPIRSNGDALGQYVGKYIGKHIGQRHERDKGARLVSYSQGARMATSKHAAVSKYPNEWRAKVLTFSRMVQAWKPQLRVECLDDIGHALGDKRWSYNWRDFILALPPSDLAVPF